MTYRITHTEHWPYKCTEHDDITLPKEAMISYLGDLLWHSIGVEVDGDRFTFTQTYQRADGDLDTMEHVVRVEKVQADEVKV